MPQQELSDEPEEKCSNLFITRNLFGNKGIVMQKRIK
jgi:hypothetical protein